MRTIRGKNGSADVVCELSKDMRGCSMQGRGRDGENGALPSRNCLVWIDSYPFADLRGPTMTQAVESLITMKMLVPGSSRRIVTVDKHAGMAFAGLQADGKVLAGRAQDEARNYHDVYGDLVPGTILSERMGRFLHLFALYGSVRPFGASVLLAVYDMNGPQVYLLEPSGQVNRYFGTAIGKGKQQAKTEIEKLNLSEMTCEEGVKALARIIYTVHDEAKDKEFELQMSWVCDASGRKHVRVPADLVREAEELAKAALEDMDSD